MDTTQNNVEKTMVRDMLKVTVEDDDVMDVDPVLDKLLDADNDGIVLNTIAVTKESSKNADKNLMALA